MHWSTASVILSCKGVKQGTWVCEANITGAANIARRKASIAEKAYRRVLLSGAGGVTRLHVYLCGGRAKIIVATSF